MDWQDYVEKVMKNYLVGYPDRKQFPTTRIIEKLRDLAIAERDGEFAKIWNDFDEKQDGVISRLKHIKSVLEKMVKAGKLTEKTDERAVSSSYSLVS